MGILVREAILPSGVQVSDVYMSFSGEVIMINPKRNDTYVVHSWYKVFSDVSKSKQSDSRIQISVETDDINTYPAPVILYNALKQQYPGAVDVHE